MRKAATIILILIVLLPAAARALEQTGLDYGNQVGGDIKGKLNSSDAVDTRLQQPLTKSTPLKTMDDSKQSVQDPFCGQGEVQDEKLAIEVTLDSTGNITASTDTNEDGTIDATNTFVASQICIDGYQTGSGPTAAWYTWTITTGAVTSSGPSAFPLNGCMNPTSNTATYIGGPISKKWAEATGKKITNSSLTGNTVRYYAGTIKDCKGTEQTPTATKYYDNPYTLNDAAIQQSVLCTLTSTDPACQAYASTRAAQTNVSSQGQSGGACSIERTVVDSTTHTSDIICEANRIYYPSPYTNANPTCFKTAGDRWDYNQQFRFKCDPYGKQLNLQAWAWWEGAPCGNTSTALDFANYPPPYQVTYSLPYGGNSAADTIIGQLSVNRRMGQNITYKDMTDTTCYSDDTISPLKVHMTYACNPGNSSCTYNFITDNSLACPNISYTHAPPPDEQISDGCLDYENNKNCSIQNETWFDATGNGVQTIKEGASTNNQLQVYDANNPISPLPITCKNTFVNIPPVCKDWWRKERTYKCEASYNKNQPYLTRAENVIATTTDNDVSNFSYQKSVYNKENTPKCVLEVNYTSADIANCFANGLNIYCPIKYTYNDADHICTRAPNCSPHSYIEANNRCEYDPGPTPICDPQFPVYDSLSNMCQGDPICNIGTFHDIHNRCEVDITPTCPSPLYTYHGELNPPTCTFEPPPCPDNYIYDSTVNNCQPTAALCPSPPGTYTPPPAASCTSDYSCGTDTLDPTEGNCYHTAGKTCYTGYLPDNTNNVCYKMQGDCDYGTWNPTYAKCTGDREYICQPGFTLSGNKCIDDPTCPSHNNKPVDYASGCTAPKEMSCTSPYGSTGTLCASTPTCPPGNNAQWVSLNNRCEITTSNNYKCSKDTVPNYATIDACQNVCYDETPCTIPPLGTLYVSYSYQGSYQTNIPQTIQFKVLNPSQIQVGAATVTLTNFTAISGDCTMSTTSGWSITASGTTLTFSNGCKLTFSGVNLTGQIYWSLIETDGTDDYPPGTFTYRLTTGGGANVIDLNWHEIGGYGNSGASGSITAQSPNYTCPYDVPPTTTYPCTGTPLKCQRQAECYPAPLCTAPYQNDNGTCYAPGICPDGQQVTLDTHQCEKAPDYKCYLPYTDNGMGQCQATPHCDYSAPITVINGTDKCTLDATMACKDPSIWNPSLLPSGLCEANATCPSKGIINNLRCETPFIPDCTQPYTADATGTKCVRAVTCPIGDYDKTLGKCIMRYSTPTPLCPDQGHFDGINDRCYQTPATCTAGMFPDLGENKCWIDPSCGIGKLNATIHKCEYKPKVCLTDWLYDTTNRLCYRPPTCPSGSMNYTKDRCEAAPQCQKTTYPEMDCVYQQPTTKTSLQCMSNDPIPDCAVAPTCPMAGTLNGSICTVNPDVKCPNGYQPNGTNCTANGNCPSANGHEITIDYNNSRCNTPTINGCNSPYSLKDATCQLETLCSPGTYDGTQCVYTPPTKYICPGSTTPQDDINLCQNQCYARFSGGGTLNDCSTAPWSINATGNTLFVGDAVINLVGFTATGGYGPISPCIGCGSGNEITISPSTSTQWAIKRGANQIGVIQLSGGATTYAGMTMTIRNGTECTAPGQNTINFIFPNNNICVREIDSIDGMNSQICVNGTSLPCNPYTQCPDNSWTKDGTTCHKTVLCPGGGNWQLVGTKWVCIATPATSCPGNYGIRDGLCAADLTCPSPGQVDATLQACKAPAEYTCPSKDYTINDSGICIGSAQCPTGGKPSGGTEASRKVYQKCVDPEQCKIKCSVRVGGAAGAAYTEGYYLEARLCTDNGNDSYTCPITAGEQEEKPCACVTETWNQALTDPSCTNYAQYKDTADKIYIIRCKYDSTGCKSNPTDCMPGEPYRCSKISPSDTPTTFQTQEICCEPACTVTRDLAIPNANSVVKREYEVKQCVSYNNSPDAYTCPVQTGETINQDCQCVDQFGMTASIFSAIVETAKDRVCEP